MLKPSNQIDTVPVSVMVFTLNEEIHLPSCLDSLHWCDDIVIVDSFSSDRTIEIAKNRGARTYSRKFDGFGTQRNWALETIDLWHDWVLILDADERVPPELSQEIKYAVENADAQTGAFRLRRRFYLWGKWLRYSSLYPTWVVRLVHRKKVRYVNRGHAETQHVDGRILSLEQDLIDENLKGMEAWFERQNRYSAHDAEFELQEEGNATRILSLLNGDPLKRRAALKEMSRNIPARPWLYFWYAYIWRRGFLDGKEGFMFCVMRAMYQRMVVIKKFDLARKQDKG